MSDTLTDNRRKPGYFQVDNEVIENYQLTAYTGWLYCAIAKYASANGEAFPSISTLAELTSMSRPTIIKNLAELEKRNLIKVTRSKGKGKRNHVNHYFIQDVVKTSDLELIEAVNAVGGGSKPPLLGVVNEVDCNKTQVNNTVEQETGLPKEGNPVTAAPKDAAAIEIDSDIAEQSPTPPSGEIVTDWPTQHITRIVVGMQDELDYTPDAAMNDMLDNLGDALRQTIAEPKEKLLSPAQAMQKAIRDAFGSDGLTKAHYGIIGRKAKELMNSTPPYTGDDVGFMVAWARLPAQKKEFWNGIKILDLHKIAYSWAQAGRPKVYDESKMTLQQRVDAGLEHPDAIHLADPNVKMFTEWTPEYEAELLADGCTQEAIDISKRLFKHCEHPELTKKSQEAGDDSL